MNLSGRGDAFEFKEDTQLIEKRGERSTPAGVPDFCPDVEGRSPEDPLTGHRKQSAPPLGCRTIKLARGMRCPKGGHRERKCKLGDPKGSMG